MATTIIAMITLATAPKFTTQLILQVIFARAPFFFAGRFASVITSPSYLPALLRTIPLQSPAGFFSLSARINPNVNSSAIATSANCRTR
jgi:hypothetical protein